MNNMNISESIMDSLIFFHLWNFFIENMSCVVLAGNLLAIFRMYFLS